jgi:hypothetical protein
VVGNILLIVAFGAPTLRVLRRFKRRFVYEYRPSFGTQMPSTQSQALSYRLERGSAQKAVGQKVVSR